MEINWWLIVGTLGPLGLIGIIRASVTAYNDWKHSKQPRFELAPQDQVFELEDTLAEMMPRLFGFSYEDCLITDDSSVGDFTPDFTTEDIAANLFREYGIQLADLPDDRLVSIARAIKQAV